MYRHLPAGVHTLKGSLQDRHLGTDRDTMTKRISVTLKDEEYACVLQAVAKVITETNANTNPTEYIRAAINNAVCRDLNIGSVSETTEIKE